MPQECASRNPHLTGVKSLPPRWAAGKLEQRGGPEAGGGPCAAPTKAGLRCGGPAPRGCYTFWLRCASRPPVSWCWGMLKSSPQFRFSAHRAGADGWRPEQSHAGHQCAPNFPGPMPPRLRERKGCSPQAGQARSSLWRCWLLSGNSSWKAQLW